MCILYILHILLFNFEHNICLLIILIVLKFGLQKKNHALEPRVLKRSLRRWLLVDVDQEVANSQKVQQTSCSKLGGDSHQEFFQAFFLPKWLGGRQRSPNLRFCLVETAFTPGWCLDIHLCCQFDVGHQQNSQRFRGVLILPRVAKSQGISLVSKTTPKMLFRKCRKVCIGLPFFSEKEKTLVFEVCEKKTSSFPGCFFFYMDSFIQQNFWVIVVFLGEHMNPAKTLWCSRKVVVREFSIPMFPGQKIIAGWLDAYVW